MYARLWINNDSRFHINVKVMPLFFMEHARTLAYMVSWAEKPHSFLMSFLNTIIIILIVKMIIIVLIVVVIIIIIS